MGYEDLQVLLLLLLGVSALGKHGAAQEAPTRPPPPPVSALPPPSPPSISSQNSSGIWTVGSDINIVDRKQILTSANNNFSFSLIVIKDSSCLAVVKHIPSNVTIWVANFNNNTRTRGIAECVLNFTRDGLVLASNVGWIWSADVANKQNATNLELDDNGRLFLWNQDSKMPEWESFDYPTDTLVTGQKLNVNYSLSAAQLNWEYSTGSLFFMRVDMHQVVLYENFFDNGVTQSIPYYNVTEMMNDTVVDHVELQPGGLHYFLNNNTNLSIPDSSREPSADWHFARLAPNGGLMILSYLGAQPINNRTINSGICSLPGQCGSYGICSGVGKCTCPLGFEELVNSSGCERKEALNTTRCTEDTFVSVFGNTYIGFLNNTTRNFDAESCKKICSGDCSCEMALHVRENQTSLLGTCYMHLGDSMQTIRQIGTNETYLQTLFLRVVNGSDLNPVVPGPSTKSSRKAVASAFAGGAGAFAFALLASSAWFLYYSRRKLFEIVANENYDSAGKEWSSTERVPQFTYQEVVESTSNFAEKLGSGGFSCVYLGHLPDNTKIAVKKLDDNEHKEKEFLAAVATVGRISHANLVPLRGFCKEGQHRILVYELVNEGRSLNRFLFPLQNSSSLINAQTRRSIALGTARGLAHLHEDCNSSSVLHGGVKPENIVIDRKMHPRLVDFGLVSLMSRDQRLSDAQMRGSRGYMAPEWVKSQPITEKVDVYSLGIVILELVSGRRCLKQGASPEKCFLPSWGFSLLRHSEGDPDRILELVDPLLDVRNLPAADQEVLKGMIYVALWCVQEEASMRPPMKKVVRILEGDAFVDTPPYSPALDVFAREMCAGYAGERAPESSNNSFMHSNSLKRNSEMRLR